MQLDDQQKIALFQLIAIIFIIIAVIVIMMSLMNMFDGYAYAESRNVTLTIEKGDLWWCYNGEKSMKCDMAQVDTNNFRLLSNFLEYLNSGVVELEK